MTTNKVFWFVTNSTNFVPQKCFTIWWRQQFSKRIYTTLKSFILQLLKTKFKYSIIYITTICSFFFFVKFSFCWKTFLTFKYAFFFFFEKGYAIAFLFFKNTSSLDVYCSFKNYFLQIPKKHISETLVLQFKQMLPFLMMILFTKQQTSIDIKNSKYMKNERKAIIEDLKICEKRLLPPHILLHMIYFYLFFDSISRWTNFVYRNYTTNFIQNESNLFSLCTSNNENV